MKRPRIGALERNVTCRNGTQREPLRNGPNDVKRNYEALKMRTADDVKHPRPTTRSVLKLYLVRNGIQEPVPGDFEVSDCGEDELLKAGSGLADANPDAYYVGRLVYAYLH